MYTVDRWYRDIRVVGYACINVFMDPKQQAAPLSRNIHDYVLHQVRGQGTGQAVGAGGLGQACMRQVMGLEGQPE